MLLRDMFAESKRLGTLRFFVSVYVNVLVNTAMSKEVCDIVLEDWLIAQLFSGIIGAPIRGRIPSSRVDKHHKIAAHLSV